MITPLLSIAVAAHNCGDYLALCLESLKDAIGEAFDLCEILLINDASSDNTEHFCNNFLPSHPNIRRFNVIFENIGMVRNFSVKNCKGDYITMLDGDDLLAADSLPAILRFLQSHRPDMLITKLNEVRTTIPTYDAKRFQPQQMSRDQAIKEYLIHRSFQAHFTGKFIRSAILKKHNFPDFSCYEDSFLFPEILQASESIYYSAIGPYYYFKRVGSLSSSLDEIKLNLYKITLNRMSYIFGERYASLQVCHWIEFVNRYDGIIAKWNDRHVIKELISTVNPLFFLLNPTVRLSFKRKYFKVKKTTKAW